MMRRIGGDLLLALGVRLVVLKFSVLFDEEFQLKFTDIDYHVFTDAARHVVDGNSPYLRGTYRYTPILAWMVVPNITFLAVWGKLCFMFGDILSAYLIFKILATQQVPFRDCRLAMLLWLYNPLTIAISTRGSAESIVAVLVLATLYLLETKHLVIAGLVYGLSIHFKIYPIIYCLPLYFSIAPDEAPNFRSLHNSIPNFAHKTLPCLTILYPTPNRSTFTLATIFSLAILSLTFYSMYGSQFLQETYFYHVVRKDTKHNFSPYFYLLYLTADWEHSLLELATFLPQATLMILIAVKFHSESLPFCLFLQTFVFVTFNKVCTSQYFIWYLTFVPLIMHRVKFSLKRASSLFLLWLASQALWLLFAYFLEFQSLNTFLSVWLAGLVFFLVNVMIAGQFVEML